MAAIAFSSLYQPRAAPRPRLVPTRSADHRPPSAAVRRRRAVTALVALAALGALLGVGSLAGAEQVPPASEPDPGRAVPVVSRLHVVQPGDTLWTLARSLQPDGDVRPLVARLRAVRGEGPLLPGERLRLPV